MQVWRARQNSSSEDMEEVDLNSPAVSSSSTGSSPLALMRKSPFNNNLKDIDNLVYSKAGNSKNQDVQTETNVDRSRNVIQQAPRRMSVNELVKIANANVQKNNVGKLPEFKGRIDRLIKQLEGKKSVNQMTPEQKAEFMRIFKEYKPIEKDLLKIQKILKIQNIAWMRGKITESLSNNVSLNNLVLQYPIPYHR